MNQLSMYLKANVSGTLSTVSKGLPDARPFQFQFIEDGKLIFATSSTKTVYEQLLDNPFIAYTTQTDDGTVVRIYGEVKFIDDLHIKEKILLQQPQMKLMFQSSENPMMKVFYLDHGKATVCNLKSNQAPLNFIF
ncbi:pyridoxamine 5'-phosphate oxidase family protein [Turicibacter sanguinis]|uniref:pyridoxamine 5'-phosphate oxidase family protein n=1 Tax=Turicibacter sanguinis TaxID=154288 RepID=UPI0032EEFD2C